MPLSVTVPERAFEPLRSVARASKKSQKDLHEALEGTEQLRSPSDLIKLLRSSIAPAVDDERAGALVSELFSIAQLLDHHEHTPQSASSAIAQFEGLELAAAERASLSSILEVLLSSRAFTGLASAAAVYAEHDRLFFGARVYVDARPVFDMQTESPFGSILTRKLRVAYFENGRPHEIEIALEEDNVATLRRALERGEVEAAAAKQLLSNAGLVEYSFEDPTEE